MAERRQRMADLDDEAAAVLREIVREIVRVHPALSGLPADEAVDGVLRLVDAGLLQIVRTDDGPDEDHPHGYSLRMSLPDGRVI